ncbi:MAG: phage virion morphogenesis protein [Deltaproteobacteria bacterium]|nr:phage virion morphogenesis protein [Deltaproteobacteria bacterium]
MAGTLFELDLGPLETMVDKAIREVGRTQDLMEAAGETLVSSTLERFETETDPEGKKWKQSKRAEKEGGQTLTKTAVLKNSISYEASNDLVIYGTSNDIYAAIHQFGGAAVGMPEIVARAYIGISEEDIEEIKEMVAIHMRESFGI